MSRFASVEHRRRMRPATAIAFPNPFNCFDRNHLSALHIFAIALTLVASPFACTAGSTHAKLMHRWARFAASLVSTARGQNHAVNGSSRANPL